MSVSTGAVLHYAVALLRAGLPGAAIAFAVLMAIGLVIDTGLVDEQGAGLMNLAATAVTLIAQYRLTRASLYRMLGAPPDGGGMGAFILLGIVAGLGVLLGLVLLVVPGIVLAVRWSISTPILLAGRQGVTEALARSWRATEGHFWPVLFALLVAWGPGLVLSAGGALILEATPGAFGGALLVNFGLVGMQVFAWYVALALFYLILRPDLKSEIFV